MKIRLDRNGNLTIERNGSFHEQICPFQKAPDGSQQECGDHCPLFGEPVMGKVHAFVYKLPFKDPDFLSICQDLTLYGEVIDERAKS